MRLNPGKEDPRDFCTVLGPLVAQTVSVYQCGRPGFDSWVGKIPWLSKWKPTPVLFPRKSYGRRSLVQVTVHGVAKSRTRLSDFTFTFHFHALEKKMATHSSVLAWRIPGTGKPGGLPSMGSAQSRTRLKRLSSSSSDYIMDSIDLD